MRLSDQSVVMDAPRKLCFGVIPIAHLRYLIYPYPTFVRGVEDALRQIGG